MSYNMKLFWHRAANLYKMYQGAKDPDFKRIWMDKLQELMRGLKKLDKRELNWYNTTILWIYFTYIMIQKCVPNFM